MNNVSAQDSFSREMSDEVSDNMGDTPSEHSNEAGDGNSDSDYIYIVDKSPTMDAALSFLFASATINYFPTPDPPASWRINEHWPVMQPGVLEQRWIDELRHQAHRKATTWFAEANEESEDALTTFERAEYTPSEQSDMAYATDYETEDDWKDIEDERCELTHDAVGLCEQSGRTTNPFKRTRKFGCNKEEQGNKKLKHGSSDNQFGSASDFVSIPPVPLPEQGDFSSELEDIDIDAAIGWPLHYDNNNSHENSSRPWTGEGIGHSLWDERQLLRNAKETLEIADVSHELGICAASYNPDEVVSLLTELFDLMVTIALGEWDPSLISRYPHATSPSGPVNMRLARDLGYSDSALYIIERLPYLSNEKLNERANRMIPMTRFMRYIDDGELYTGRYTPDCFLGGSQRQPLSYERLDEWIVPIAQPADNSIWGYSLLLDTRIGSIKVWRYMFEYYCPESQHWMSIEPPSTATNNLAYTYRLLRCVPAAQYLRHLIEAYSNLDAIPNIDPLEANNSEDYEMLKQMKMDIARLYRETGWPDDWRREEFMCRRKREVDPNT